MSKNLTIIVPIYNPAIPISSILNNLYKQKSQNFDVVITIDRPKDEHFFEIDELQLKFKDRLKVIFNTSHQHIDLVIKQALNLVKTPYIFILYSYCHIKSEFVQRIDNFLNNEKTKPDFVELPGSIKGVPFFGTKLNNNFNSQVINLKDNKEPFVFVTPFVFNYFVKTNIALEIFSKPKIKESNLEYSPNFVYRSLLESQTFAFFEGTWVENLNYSFVTFNPKSLTRCWNSVFSCFSDIDQETKEALEFAMFMNYCYYISGFIGIFKTKKGTLASKSLNNIKAALLKEIETLKPKWEEQIKNNSYFSRFSITNLKKLTNDFKTKWELIFKKFTW
ncbi:glycosyltransferase family 2 protein [Mycoplasma enhydrae]|uniref:glycosyltransferase family 2 protein n=1 Tax=Mycoplasma enhydrae TaxID=2499220 RepID=UPI00197C01B2|nr:glycosyltransferase family 2 protein [Mycoplasma enhydrae]MBN4089625.1 glycosyltransferase family 2 protein [Mycoplasma enhydrae]MCV3753536.1 glycosyltransferase family 2 protein [Mycoplasma enhydrae]